MINKIAISRLIEFYSLHSVINENINDSCLPLFFKIYLFWNFNPFVKSLNILYFYYLEKYMNIYRE